MEVINLSRRTFPYSDSEPKIDNKTVSQVRGLFLNKISFGVGPLSDSLLLGPLHRTGASGICTNNKHNIQGR